MWFLPIRQISHTPLLSDGFTSNDVVYEWTGTTEESVKVTEGLKMAQFDLVGIQAVNGTQATREGTKRRNTHPI